jgi:hypothetical protein
MKRLFNMTMARELCDSAHGSGLDTTPYITQSKSNVLIDWDFHMMDNQGYYCGYWRFVVWIPKANPLKFRLTGRKGNTRSAAAYDLKYHLEERIGDAMDGVLDRAGVVAEFVNGAWSYDGGVEADV